MAQWIKRGICIGLIFLFSGCQETKITSVLKQPRLTRLSLDYPYLNKSLDGKMVEQDGEVYLLQVFDDAFCLRNEKASMKKEEICVPITAAAVDEEIANLDSAIVSYFENMGLPLNQVSYFYENLVTGERVGWNLDHEYAAASTIKLGMAMLYTDLVAEGSLPKDLKIAYLPEVDFEAGLGEVQYQAAASLLDLDFILEQMDLVAEGSLPKDLKIAYLPEVDFEAGLGEVQYQAAASLLDLDFILEQMILNSDNCALNMLARYYTSVFHEDFRLGLNRYLSTLFTMEDAYANTTTPQKMWELMDALVDNSISYADILEDMSHAYEGRYLKKLDVPYTIYQKWGYYAGYSHVLGVIEAPQPFIVGIYTEMLADGEAVIADLAELMVEYNRSNLNDGFHLNGEKIFFEELID